MAKKRTQRAKGRRRCGVEVKDWFGETVPCGGTRQAHLKKDLKHEYGQETVTFPECGACGNAIERGELYDSWKTRRAGTHIRHTTCPRPSRSSMTSSEILAMAWDVADQPIPSFETLDDLDAFIEQSVAGVEDIVLLIEEKMAAIEEGMGHTSLPVYEELEVRLDVYRQWAEEINEFVGAFNEDFDEPDEDAFERMEAYAAEAISGCPE